MRQKILLCSAVYDKCGSPLLSSILKFTRYMFQEDNQFADYLSHWHSDPLARDSFYCLCNDSGQVFQFQDVDSVCFSFDVARQCFYEFFFCFLCFSFLELLTASGQRLSTDVSLINLQSLVARLINLAPRLHRRT